MYSIGHSNRDKYGASGRTTTHSLRAVPILEVWQLCMAVHMANCEIPIIIDDFVRGSEIGILRNVFVLCWCCCVP